MAREQSSPPFSSHTTYNPQFSKLGTLVGGSTCCNFHRLGAPEQVLGGRLPWVLGLLWKIIAIQGRYHTLTQYLSLPCHPSILVWLTLCAR